MNRISLIIPCYRDAATITRALESVYRQTRPVEEVIVVIDCSPETEEIERVLRAFPHVVLVKHAVNLGLAATRNTGVEAATGDIVTFLDADDELHPQKIELQMHVMQNEGASTCEVLKVPPGASDLRHRPYQGPTPVETMRSVKKLLRSNRLTGASLMISKELLRRVGGYDASLRSCEDYDLWLRLLESGTAVQNIRLPLYIYHANPAGLSKDCRNISYWEAEVLRKYFVRARVRVRQSSMAGLVWGWWMLKHVMRAQKYRDSVLQARTVENIKAMAGHPMIREGILLAARALAFSMCFRLKQ
ncbi:MAG: glycosyltransferase family 2 protein [Nitrospira sp.]|nr:glycosyltransferase family 2 protein [Nitrospira sp.]